GHAIPLARGGRGATARHRRALDGDDPPDPRKPDVRGGDGPDPDRRFRGGEADHSCGGDPTREPSYRDLGWPRDTHQPRGGHGRRQAAPAIRYPRPGRRGAVIPAARVSSTSVKGKSQYDV